jgi:hypothetical protein
MDYWSYLWVRKIVERLLISGISISEIILNEEAVAEGIPAVTIFVRKTKDTLKVLDRLDGGQMKLVTKDLNLPSDSFPGHMQY